MTKLHTNIAGKDLGEIHGKATQGNNLIRWVYCLKHPYRAKKSNTGHLGKHSWQMMICLLLIDNTGLLISSLMSNIFGLAT